MEAAILLSLPVSSRVDCDFRLTLYSTWCVVSIAYNSGYKAELALTRTPALVRRTCQYVESFEDICGAREALRLFLEGDLVFGGRHLARAHSAGGGAAIVADSNSRISCTVGDYA